MIPQKSEEISEIQRNPQNSREMLRNHEKTGEIHRKPNCQCQKLKNLIVLVWVLLLVPVLLLMLLLPVPLLMLLLPLHTHAHTRTTHTYSRTFTSVHVVCTWYARGMHVVCTWCAAAFQRPAASLQRACSEELTLVSKTWFPSGNYEGLRGHRECGTSAMRS